MERNSAVIMAYASPVSGQYAVPGVVPATVVMLAPQRAVRLGQVPAASTPDAIRSFVPRWFGFPPTELCYGCGQFVHLK